MAQNVNRGVRIPGLMSARSVLLDGENCFVFVFHDMTEAQRTSDELTSTTSMSARATRTAARRVQSDAINRT